MNRSTFLSTFRFLIAMYCFAMWPAFAAPLMHEVHGKLIHGRVSRVTDGDTIVIFDQDGRRISVRIVAIDAPEKRRKSIAGQPYAKRSGQNLAKLVNNKTVRLISQGHDDYGRLLARLWISDVDAGLAQVCAGYAWVYEAFVTALSATDQHAYRACQLKARKETRGLWRDAHPMPPWAWRHSNHNAPARP